MKQKTKTRLLIIIIPNLLMIDAEEVDALREFVVSGGSLYASKHTSLLTKDGERKDNFLLSDLFGASYIGETEEEITYIMPKGKDDLLKSVSPDYPLINFGTQIKVKPEKEEEVVALISLPYTNPKDTTHFASIHGNPHGPTTQYPAIILRKFGKGKVCYVAGDLEAAEYDSHQIVFINLVKGLAKRPFAFEVDGPKSVEVTLFHQEGNKRYLINILNFQQELPNIPVQGIRVKIRLDGKASQRLTVLPDEKELPYEVKDNYLEVVIPRLETFMMLGLDYS